MQAKQREFFINMISSMILAGVVVHGAAFVATGLPPTPTSLQQTAVYLSIAAVVSISLGLLAK